MTLWNKESERVRLSCYAPGTVHAAHDHDLPHLSLVLCGIFEESDNRGASEVFGGNFILRPFGARHAVRFGPAGAMVLTIETEAVQFAQAASARWHPNCGASSRLVATLRKGEWDGDTLSEFLGEAGAVAVITGPSPPQALKYARQWLAEDGQASINDIARGNGFHPVHFARLFRRFYGTSPSRFRRQCRTARAMAAILSDGKTLASAAHDAGFADQSHMTRAVGEYCGLPAGRLKRLMRTSAAF